MDKESKNKDINLFKMARNFEIEKDYKTAFEYYNKANDNGQYIALPYIARCYFFGFGVEKDIKKGTELAIQSFTEGFRLEYDIDESLLDQTMQIFGNGKNVLLLLQTMQKIIEQNEKLAKENEELKSKNNYNNM